MCPYSLVCEHGLREDASGCRFVTHSHCTRLGDSLRREDDLWRDLRVLFLVFVIWPAARAMCGAMARSLAKVLARPTHLLIPSITIITSRAAANMPRQRLLSCVIPVRLKEVRHPAALGDASFSTSSSARSASTASSRSFSKSTDCNSACNCILARIGTVSLALRRATASTCLAPVRYSSSKKSEKSEKKKKSDKKAARKSDSSSSSSSDSDSEEAPVAAKKEASQTTAKPPVPSSLFGSAARDEVLAYLQEPKKIRFGLLKVIVTIFLGIYFGAFLAKFSANLLEEYEIFVKGDDDDD